eukprot:scaffold8307_cov119-Isochrysis_galbana.AAC.3
MDEHKFEGWRLLVGLTVYKHCMVLAQHAKKVQATKKRRGAHTQADASTVGSRRRRRPTEQHEAKPGEEPTGRQERCDT